MFVMLPQQLGKRGAIYRQYQQKDLTDTCRPNGRVRSEGKEAYPLLGRLTHRQEMGPRDS